MTHKLVTRSDGVVVEVSFPEYRDDAVFATPDHPYGTAGETFGHEGHWTDPNGRDAA